MRYKIGFIYRDPNGTGTSIESIFQNIQGYLRSKSEHQYINIYIDEKKSYVYNRRKILNYDCDLYHITGDVYYYAMLLFPYKVTQTIHDVGTLKKLGGIKKIVYKWWWHALPLIFVKSTTCVSRYTKSDLLKYLQIRNVHVIANPVDGRLEYIKKAMPKSSVKILIIGTGKHKNVPRMLRALNGIDYTLSIVGKLSDEIRNTLESEKIVFTNYYNISSDEIRQLYQECDLVLFVSLHEGFGMPVIEANAVGRPTITSNVCSLPEVAGESAILVDPLSELSIRNGIEKLLSDEILWNKCVEEGQTNIKKYDLSVISLQYENLFLGLLENHV